MTGVGVLGVGALAAIDSTGIVRPSGASWHLAWRVGAEDGWHDAASGRGVRQGLSPGGGAIVTRMRIPGGDVVHRAYAAPDRGRAVVIVELVNDTPVPVAVSLECAPAADGAAGTVLVDGSEVRIDDHQALLAERRPAHVAVATRLGAAGQQVVEGRAEARTRAEARSAQGTAEVALVWPVPHRTSLRVVLPAVLPGDGEPLPAPDSMPDVNQVDAGWQGHLDAATRVDLPDDAMAATIAAARRHLLVVTADDDAAGIGAGRSWRRGPLAVALDEWGHHAEARSLLLRGVAGTELAVADDDQAGTAAFLFAIDRHLQLWPDAELARSLVEPIGGAVGRLAKTLRGSWWRKVASDALPRPGAVPDFVGDEGAVSWDVAWMVGGLFAAARALEAAGDERAAGDTSALATDLAGRVARIQAERIGDDLGPSAPGALVGVVLGVVGASSPLASRAVDSIEAGPQTPFAIGLAGMARTRRGDPDAVQALAELTARGGPTGAIATDEASHDPLASATFLMLAREQLASDRTGRLLLLPVISPRWIGEPIEVHGAPTRHGELSFAIRWHDERPAVLWDLAPWPGAGAPRLSVPGLDRGWSSVRSSGEALLAPTDGPRPRRA